MYSHREDCVSMDCSFLGYALYGQSAIRCIAVCGLISRMFCDLILVTTCEADVTIPLYKLELKSLKFGETNSRICERKVRC